MTRQMAATTEVKTRPIPKPSLPKDATVLVVEDNVSNFVLIPRMLGYMGIHCEWKTSGYEVVEYADTLPRSTWFSWTFVCRMRMAISAQKNSFV